MYSIKRNRVIPLEIQRNFGICKPYQSIDSCFTIFYTGDKPTYAVYVKSDKYYRCDRYIITPVDFKDQSLISALYKTLVKKEDTIIIFIAKCNLFQDILIKDIINVIKLYYLII